MAHKFSKNDFDHVQELVWLEDFPDFSTKVASRDSSIRLKFHLLAIEEKTIKKNFELPFFFLFFKITTIDLGDLSLKKKC